MNRYLNMVHAAMLAVVFLFAGTFSLNAVDGDWELDGGSGNWSDFSNWSSAPFVPGTEAGDVINITNSIGSDTTVTIDTTSRTVGTLNIGNAGAGFFLNASGGGYLTMDNNGDEAWINLLASGGNVNASVISAPLRVTAGGLRINNQSGITRAITASISNTTNNLQWLTVNSSGGNVQLQGVIGDGDGGGQLGVLWDLAGGVGFMTTNNTFSGGVLIRRGSVRSNHDNAFGTGTITLGDALTSGTAQLDIAANRTLANNIIASSAAASGTLEIMARNGAQGVIQGTLTVQRALSITTTGASSLTFTGDFSGAGRITANGNANAASFISIAGNNASFSGGITTTTNLLLKLGHNAALGSGSLIINGTNVRLDSTKDVSISTNPDIEWNVDFTFIGSNSLNMGSGNVALGGTGDARKITVTGSVFGFDGIISGSRGLTKDGTGILSLNGINAYTGVTTITAGTLQGIGSVAGDLVIGAGATLAPGNSIGTFTVSGDVLLGTDSIFNAEFNSGSVSGDQLMVYGNVTIDDDVLLVISDIGTSTLPGGWEWIILNMRDQESTISGTFFGIGEGTLVSFAGHDFIATYMAGEFGNSFALVTLIPEPTTISLIAGLLIVGLLWSRRKK
jgi:autotransporter-associated beta strand protein